MGLWRSEPPQSHDHGRGDGSGRERSRHDHESLVAGAWRDKSEIPGPIAPPFMILKDFPEGLWKILHDHGSGGRGAWQTKSEAGPSAATARPHPARTRDITGLRGTDRANRPPKRPKVVISRHDHGSGGAGGCDAKSETAPGSSVSMIAGSSRSLRPMPRT